MPNLDELMKMAQEAQAKLMQAQEDLDKVEVQGVSGGGMVRIRASAKGRIIGVDIDESLLAPSEKQMLEDLVAAAINDARGKADAAAADIYASAYSRDPEFYRFLKTMTTLKESFDPETVMVLSTDGDLLRYLNATR